MGHNPVGHGYRRGAAGARLQLLELSPGLRIAAHPAARHVQQFLSARADHERGTGGEPARHAARRVGGLSARRAAGRRSRVHAQLYRAEWRRDQRGRDAAAERDSAAMRGPDGRTARRSVALTLAMVLLPAVGPSGRLAAQTEGSVLTSLPGSTRSAALGGAGVALVGDAGAMFANPAGIATIHHLSIEGSYEPYLAGSAVSAAALALRVGRLTWG